MNLEQMRTLDDFEESALAMLKPLARRYFTATAGKQYSLNQSAFEKYKIKPKVLRDVKEVDTSTSLLGCKMPFPIGIAPTGLQRLANVEGEMVVAKGAKKADCLLTVSCVSTDPLEDIARFAHPFLKWIQLYVFKDRNLTLKLLRQAEASGFSAVVLTADSPVGGLWRTSMPPEFFASHGNSVRNLPKPTNELLSPSVGFTDISWLKEMTHLPIVVKGIMRGDDAVEAVRHGASAIWVSNHGARQVDGVSATIDALPEVVEALRGCDVEVYLDGGVRRGCDVYKALALGAKAVFIGRPVIYGLAVAGEAGVLQLLDILKNEFLLTMKLTGVNCLQDINHSMIQKDVCFGKL